MFVGLGLGPRTQWQGSHGVGTVEGIPCVSEVIVSFNPVSSDGGLSDDLASDSSGGDGVELHAALWTVEIHIALGAKDDARKEVFMRIENVERMAIASTVPLQPV